MGDCDFCAAYGDIYNPFTRVTENGCCKLGYRVLVDNWKCEYPRTQLELHFVQEERLQCDDIKIQFGGKHE